MVGAGAGTDRGGLIGVLQPHSAASSKPLAQKKLRPGQPGNGLRGGFASIGVFVCGWCLSRRI